MADRSTAIGEFWQPWGTGSVSIPTFSFSVYASMNIFVILGLFRHFETVTNIRTWIKSHRFWRML